MPFKDLEKRREATRKWSQKWRAKNPEKALAAGRTWRANNLDRARQLIRDWHRANPEKSKKWRKNNPERARELNWKRHGINLTYKEFLILLDNQNGGCAICQKPDGTKLCADHCHATGTFRGLLCRACNRGLGSFNDSPTTFEEARQYLRRPTTDIRYTSSAGRRNSRTPRPAHRRWKEIETRLLVQQGGVCALCTRTPIDRHIDHDHLTGMVRGVLCENCNLGLGQFQEDPRLLESAIAYLTNAACVL